MSEILTYVLNTNLFNFIIFAAAIICLCIKLDVSQKLQISKDAVKENVMASETAKKESESKLSDIEGKLANLQNEVEEIISKSSDNANLVGNQIIADAKQTVENIKNNSKKMVENKALLLRNDILKRASLASVEIAKNQIISELNSNNELHQKLIDESVEAISNLKGGFANG